MAIKESDLLYVWRQGDKGYKTEYKDLKSDVLGGIVVHDGVYVGDSEPSDPFEGDLWWNPDAEEMRIYVAKDTEGVVTALGVRAGGSGYTAASDVPTFNGHGNDLTVTIAVDAFKQISSATVSNGGHGYKVGDVVNPVQDGGSFGALQVQTVNTVATGSWQVAGYNLSNLPDAD